MRLAEYIEAMSGLKVWLKLLALNSLVYFLFLCIK